MKSSILPIIVFVLFTSSLRSQVNTQADLGLLTSGNDRITSLKINFSQSGVNTFNSYITLFKNLSDITFLNYDGKNLPSEFYKLKNINSLTLETCRNLDFDRVFNKLAKNNSLSSLTLVDDNISNLSDNFSKLKSLEKINLSDNLFFNLENSINVLSELKNLKVLTIGVSELSELPASLTTLRSLVELNIIVNGYLNDEEKKAPLILSSVNKKNGVTIKIFTEEEMLKQDELACLQEIYPSLMIKKETSSDMNTEIFLDNYNYIEDEAFDIETEELDSQELENDGAFDNFKSTNKITYGKFEITGTQFRVLSPAYLHFPAVLSIMESYPDFDTLTFDERYKDFTYRNGVKIQPNESFRNFRAKKNSNQFVIFKKAEIGIRKHFCFTFNNGSIPSSYYYRYPELRALYSVKWVLDDDLSKEEFKRAFIRKKAWNDVRIYYQDLENNFVFEVKSVDTFMRFEAFPVSTYSKSVTNRDKKFYVRIFSNYMKRLTSKQKRFDNRMNANRLIVANRVNIARAQSWNSFSQMYMSNVEKKMTKNEWIKYYTLIIGNEKDALLNSDADLKLVHRLFDLDGFTGRGDIPFKVKTEAMYDLANKIMSNHINELNLFFSTNVQTGPASTPQQVLFLWFSPYNVFGNYFQNWNSNFGFNQVEFYDSNSRKLAVKQIFAVDIAGKMYYDFTGESGLDSNKLKFYEGSKVALVIQTVDNNIGIYPNLIDVNRGIPSSFKVELFDMRFASTGQIYNSLILLNK